MKAPKPKPKGFTGDAWAIVDIGGNEAQATKLEIVDGRVVKETVFESNIKIIVLEQVSGEMGEGIVTQ